MVIFHIASLPIYNVGLYDIFILKPQLLLQKSVFDTDRDHT